MFQHMYWIKNSLICFCRSDMKTSLPATCPGKKCRRNKPSTRQESAASECSLESTVANRHSRPDRRNEMPKSAKVFLPTGSLGVSFSGTPPVVANVDWNSPLTDKLQAGQIVDTITIPNELEMSGMTTIELNSVLEKYQNTPGRTLLVRDGNSSQVMGIGSSVQQVSGTNAASVPSSVGPSSVVGGNSDSYPSTLAPNTIYLQLDVDSSEYNGVLNYAAAKAGTVWTMHKSFVKMKPELPVPMISGENLMADLKTQFNPDLVEVFLHTKKSWMELEARQEKLINYYDSWGPFAAC